MRYAFCPLRFCFVAVLAPCALLFLGLFPGVVEAQGILQGISGSLEFDYSLVSTKLTDSSGNTIKTGTQDYNPRFTLNIDTKIYPNLRLHAGGQAEAEISHFKIDGLTTRTTVTRFRPYIDLTLDNPLYTAGIGYNRREDTTKVKVESLSSPSVKLVNDQYYGVLGWRPDLFPSFDMHIRRTKTFDEAGGGSDSTEDYLNLKSRYFYQGLQLYYEGTFIDNKTRDDFLNLDARLRQQIHSGRINYANTFFDRRIFLNTTYEILHRRVNTRSEGKGTVSLQIFPFAGLSFIDGDNDPSNDSLIPNPALIDANVGVSSGINIGVGAPPGADNRLRNSGLDFLNATEVNKLLVWVDRTLPTDISNSFSAPPRRWEVWISSDNLNWTLHQSIVSAPFGAFDNRFELTFTNVSTRYIKAVTDPLSPAVPGALAFPDILITEIQAFIDRAVEDVKETFQSTTHTYNLDGKARLLDNPSLFYELYFFYNQLEPSSLNRYSLSNGFSADHRFNPILTGTARVAVENGEENEEKRIAYIGNASLTADPLRTLRHSLVFYGRDEEIGGRPNDNYSLTLYNNAQLYQGIDVNLSGGVNYTHQESGEKRTDYVINLGANLVPHPTLTLGLTASDTWSRFRGGERGSGSTDTWRLDFNVSFNPFRTLYLFALLQLIDEKGRDMETVQNYGVNWSPFPDGALQFNFTYNEDYQSNNNLKERFLTPSIRWNITKRSHIDFTYQYTISKSDAQKTESHLFTTSLKIFY